LQDSSPKSEGVSGYLLDIQQISDNLLVRTLGRVFTTQDTREGYYRLFKRLYQLLQRITNSRPPIRVINGYGLDVVVTDMCTKQYFGKETSSRYLLDI
jgi:hypothetical protein